MKTFVALALAGVASAITMNDIKFMDYLAKHGKDYDTISEFNFRAALHAKTDAILAKINANPENTFTVAHNFMSDWTEEEKSKLRGIQEEEHSYDIPTLNMATSYTIKYPSSIDWKAKGAVTAVKFQGGCSSCWAFASVASVEGYWKQQSGQLVSLSEQQVIDCNVNGKGCNNGILWDGFNYAQNNKIQRDSKYPYVKKQGTCKSDGTGVKIGGWTKVIAKSVGGMKTAVARGPTAVTLAASEPIFNNYEKGIINDAAACGLVINHAVTIVGYTSTYYTIKNSWHTSWGENGYARIKINGDGDGVCGIQRNSITPYVL